MKNSTPLVPGGNNYTAMYLDFSSRFIRVRMSRWCFVWASLLLIPGIFFLGLACAFFFFEDSKFALFMLLPFGIGSGVFLWAAVWMILKIRKRCRSAFDLAERRFYPECGTSPGIPFADLKSLQILTENCKGRKHSFESHELNLVLKDDRRFNLLDHSNKERLLEEAEKLSEILSLPITDAEGRRLNGDNFLALADNFRMNLFAGIALVLLSGLCFCFIEGGHAWYWTRKSLAWEKTRGVMERVEIRTHRGKHTEYSLKFQYRYEYRGKNFSGHRRSFFDCRTSSKYDLEKCARRYPAGKEIVCYVNPRKPSDAVVDREIPSRWEIVFQSKWSIILLIGGILMLLASVRQYYFLNRRAKQKKHLLHSERL